MMTKKAWLVTNHFLYTSKFSELIGYIMKSAEQLGVTVEHYSNAQIPVLLNSRTFIKKLERPDFVIFWDKDYYLAKSLEDMGLRLFNSAEAIRLCDDKALTHIALSNNGLPSPKTMAVPFTFENIGYTKSDFLEEIAQSFSLPFVIKECKGSFGEQVYLAESIDKAKEILQKINGRLAIIQEFVKESVGTDVRINIVGGEPVVAMERKNSSDFRANITIGGTACKYIPSAEEEKLAVNACKALGLDFGGVDLLFGKDGPLVCEVNSNAHFKSIYDCTGVNVADRIMEYIIKTI